jgi:hypothetical protein
LPRALSFHLVCYPLPDDFGTFLACVHHQNRKFVASQPTQHIALSETVHQREWLPLLILHILAGSIGLLTGTVAMAVRKGGKLHRASGNVFTVAMLSLAASAFCLAILKSEEGNIVGSFGTFYLIGTAWLAGRRGERTRLIDWSALFVGVVGAVAAIALGVYTLRNPGGVDKTTAPAGMSFFFGAILLLATAGDIRMLAHGGISGRQRITRHLWRMCYGLFIATGSFFLGQQQVFPAFLRGSIFLTLPALLPLPY